MCKGVLRLDQKHFSVFSVLMFLYSLFFTKDHFLLHSVSEYEDNAFAVSFLKEKDGGFYVHPEREEIASVMEEELLVLEPPKAVSKQRTYGFQFPQNVYSIIRDYFSSQGKGVY